ncbi:MAG: DUF6158 family protein [Actinomycetes bacterium]
MERVIDLREAGPSAAGEQVIEGSQLDDDGLATALEHAYAARLEAVLHGSAGAQEMTRRVAEDLERAWLQRRWARPVSLRVMSTDPSYYLG